MKTKNSILFASFIFASIVFSSCASSNCHTKNGKRFKHSNYSQNQTQVETTAYKAL